MLQGMKIHFWVEKWLNKHTKNVFNFTMYHAYKTKQVA
jgi:hypothetical protein